MTGSSLIINTVKPRRAENGEGFAGDVTCMILQQLSEDLKLKAQHKKY